MKTKAYFKFLIYSLLFLIFVLIYLNFQLFNELNVYSDTKLAESKFGKILGKKSPNLINFRSWFIRARCQCSNNSIKINEFENSYSIFSQKNKKYHFLYKILKKKLNFTALSCSTYHSLINGPGQKIISYSLYGKNRKYYKHIDTLVKQVEKYYTSEWKIRIYHDSSIDESIICNYECKHVNKIQFCPINKIKFNNFAFYNGMYWRWIPLMDNFVDYLQCRDLDAWIIEREFQAVSEWLRSKFSFHIMRDHPFHFFPILGGLWSIALKRNRSLSSQIFSKLMNKNLIRPYNNRIYLEDQYFLVHHIWPLVQRHSMIHDSYYCDEFPSEGLVKAFPSQRANTGCFVSCSNCCEYTSNKQNLQLSINSVGHICPIECRFDKNWIYC